MNSEPLAGPSQKQMQEEESTTVEVLVSLTEKGLKKLYHFAAQEKVWTAKHQVLTDLGKGLKDVLNYGFYDPPFNGKAGKFLEEERVWQDYPLKGSPPLLELKYKRRVYRSMVFEPKALQKIHTKVNFKKMLDAVAANNPSQVTKLTDKGLDPNFHVDKTGETPLSLAVVSDDTRNMIMTLISGGAHLDFRTREGYTPLHKAAIAGKSHAVQTLLDLGASTNSRDHKGLTPLCYTVQRGGSAQCCEILLNDHAEIDVSDHQGMQPIHVACKNGLIQHLEHLLFYGVAKDSRTASGNTSLHIAALSNQEECARVLLFRGAKRDILNYANQSAHEVAAVGGNKELADLIRTFSDTDIVKISGKPTYSTRRRKTSSKPKASSVFLRANSEGQLSGQSDSLPPSPVSSTYSFPSSETSVGGRSNSMTSEGSRKEAEHKLRRTLSIGSTGSDSSYESETESHGSSTNEIRSQKMAMKQESSSSMIAPPVKLVSGAATIRKRLYASVPGKRFVAVKDYEPTRAGELALVKGDDVEVLYVGEKGYWEGRVGNETGWFHHKCVEEVKKGKQRPKTLFGRPPSSLSAVFTQNDGPDPAQPNHREQQRDQVGMPRVVTLVRNKAGFGFQMRGANSQVPRLNFQPTPEFPALQYIGEVERGGEADCRGVKCNDFILEVNNENVATATHSHVVDLIKRSGQTVTMKLVTVRPPLLNGTDELDWGAGRGLRPPPPQRDPATTLTLMRMKAGRSSLYDMSMGNSYEEPASFRMDSVIAVNKDTRWSTLQRQKPGSRKGWQLKMQPSSAGQKSKKGGPPRSKSVQDMTAPKPPPYEAVVGGRKSSAPVAVATPQVPYSAGAAYPAAESGTLTKYSLSSKSTPNLEREGIPPERWPNGTSSSAGSDEHRMQQHGLPNGSGYATEPEATVVAVGVEESRPRAEGTIVATPVLDGMPSPAHVTRSKSQPSLRGSSSEEDVLMGDRPAKKPASLSDALQEAVAARTARISRMSSLPEGNQRPEVTERKHSAPAQLNSRKKLEPADKVRSVIMEQLREGFDLEDGCRSRGGVDGRFEQSSGAYGPSRPHEQVSRPARALSVSDEYSTLPRRRSSESSASSGYSAEDDRPTSQDKPRRLTRHGSLKHSRRSRADAGTGLDPALSAHSVGKPKHKPPPVPGVPAAPPFLKEVPMTAVRQGLITADALSAKKTRLKSVSDDPHANSKPAVAKKPTRASTGSMVSQHADLLAKAVAARAARLAEQSEVTSESESKDDEWTDETRHTVPLCRANDSNNNRGSAVENVRWNANAVAKPSPPVAPKTRRISPSKVIRAQTAEPQAPRLAAEKLPDASRNIAANSHASRNSPASNHASRSLPFDLPAPLLSEEDKTMMIFDEVIRREAESENWSLNSWTGSDSSSSSDHVDGRSRPSRVSSDGRPNVSSLARASSDLRPNEQRPAVRVSSEGRPSGSSLVRASSDLRPNEQRPAVRVSSEGRPSGSSLVRASSDLRPNEERPAIRVVSESRTNGDRPLVRASSECRPMEQRPVVRAVPASQGQRPPRFSTEADVRGVQRPLSPENSTKVIKIRQISEAAAPLEAPPQEGPPGAPPGSAPSSRPWYECAPSPEEHRSAPANPQVETYDKLITTKKGIQIKLRFESKSPPPSSPCETPPPPPPPQTDYNAIDNVVPVSPRLNGAPADSRSPLQSPGRKPGLKETHFGADDYSMPPPPVAFHDDGMGDSPALPPPPEFFPLSSPMNGVAEDFGPPPPMEGSRQVSSPRRTSNEVEARNGGPASESKKEQNWDFKDLPSIFGESPEGAAFQYKSVEEWTCKDVCDWLDSIGMSQYKSTFEENDIRGIHLPELSKAELRELGIKSLGHRMTMENAIARLSKPLESSC